MTNQNAGVRHFGMRSALLLQRDQNKAGSQLDTAQCIPASSAVTFAAIVRVDGRSGALIADDDY